MSNTTTDVVTCFYVMDTLVRLATEDGGGFELCVYPNASPTGEDDTWCANIQSHATPGALSYPIFGVDGETAMSATGPTPAEAMNALRKAIKKGATRAPGSVNAGTSPAP